MKIAYICNEYPPAPHGGIGTFVHTIAHGLAEAGHEVTVLGYGKDHGEGDDQGVRVVVLPESSTRHLAWFINRRRLYSWLKREAHAGRIDVIEAPEYQGMLPFPFPWSRVVIRLHLSASTVAHYAGVSARRMVTWLETRTLSVHRNWIPVSNHILLETKRCFRRSPLRHRVIYNPFQVNGNGAGGPRVAGMPERYVMFAGTVSDRKGAFILAEAARAFLTEHPDLHLVYVGGLTSESGRYADETIRDILGEQLAARVHFTGAIEHDLVLAYMKGAKVFAFPSKLESFGLAPVEAMSCRVPVVYSKRHAGPEVVDDGVTGLLADPHSPDDVAEKVLRFLNDPPFAALLAENGEQAVKERFSLQRCIDDTLAFYECVLSQGK